MPALIAEVRRLRGILAPLTERPYRTAADGDRCVFCFELRPSHGAECPARSITLRE